MTTTSKFYEGTDRPGLLRPGNYEFPGPRGYERAFPFNFDESAKTDPRKPGVTENLCSGAAKSEATSAQWTESERLQYLANDLIREINRRTRAEAERSEANKRIAELEATVKSATNAASEFESHNASLRKTVDQLEAFVKSADEFKIWMREQFLPNLPPDAQTRILDSGETILDTTQDYLERYLNVLDATDEGYFGAQYVGPVDLHPEVFSDDFDPVSDLHLDGAVLTPRTVTIEPLVYKDVVEASIRAEKLPTRPVKVEPLEFTLADLCELKKHAMANSRVMGIDIGTDDESTQVEGYVDGNGNIYIESVKRFDKDGNLKP